MIEASFDADRSAAVSGAYQHDRGQRLHLRGLPPPDVLAQTDELVDCETVTVQAQYAFVGDSQTEARLAVWDDMQGVWTAAVPDVYMTRCEDVHVYVYVDYGQNADGQRAKTCYEAVFRPASRPAPGDSVTPGQVNAWDALVQEVNLAIASTNTAAASANGEAATAREAAERANAAAAAARETATAAASEAVNTANQAADWLRGITVSATTLAPGEQASAALRDGEAGPVLAIGVPEGIQGRPGVATINGIAVTDEGAIDLTPEDIGARPADWMPTAQEVGALSMELLWENIVTDNKLPAMKPDADNTDAIQIDWSGFTHALIIYAVAYSTPGTLCSTLARVKTNQVVHLTVANGETGNMATRFVRFTNTGLHIVKVGAFLGGSVSTNEDVVKNYCIPRYIYGIRGAKENE